MKINDVAVLKKLSVEAALFIDSIDRKIEDGQHDLGNGVYVNVEHYSTFSRDERKYENHRKYIDVQFMLEGEEVIEVLPLAFLDNCESYSKERDIEFFENGIHGIGKPNRVEITAGDFVVIFPGEAHMPCIKVNDSKMVRKAIIKIPINRIPFLFFMDIDGTLTDGMINFCETGELFKSFNVKDGYGIAKILPLNNAIPIVITARDSEIVLRRCKELGVEHCYQGVASKKEKMIEVAGEFGIYLNSDGILPGTAYIGDDIPDYECMLLAEKAGCPKDAAKEIKAISDFISDYNGGCGAVRDFIEYLFPVSEN